MYNDKHEISFELKNGKGNGKEYDFNGILKYDGEYMNGEKNGKGKEYDNKGRLIFDGEYLNGKRWKGKIKEYIYMNY